MPRTPSTHRTIVLRLKPNTARTLSMVGARDGLDIEEVLEDLVEATYSPDGKSARERQTEKATPNVDAKTAQEIDRLASRAKELR